jgi:signal transduction histidine kinase/CheY-like chemotaxis protein
MRQYKIMHLEDDPASAELVRLTFERVGVAAEIAVADSKSGFEEAWNAGGRPPDLVLSDHDVPGFAGLAALAEARGRRPGIPFVFVCASDSRERMLACLRAGADDFVVKDNLWRLPAVAGRLLHRESQHPTGITDDPLRLARLVTAVKQLSLARSIEEIAAVVRGTARALVGSDGATFVLREGDMCHYLDEDAIAPLWKGKRFPSATCISGWAMESGRDAVIPDIYQDPRIPHDAYRPTFVKSLVMVPVRREAPIAAIGTYWATPHEAGAAEVSLLQALADSTSVAMENVRILGELETRVRQRTTELELANRELGAFADSVSHDLRTPLSQILGFAELLDLDLPSELAAARKHVGHILGAGRRMSDLITGLLQLGRTGRALLAKTDLDLTALVQDVIAGLGAEARAARVQWQVQPQLRATADPNLLRDVLENLLGNALKYTGKKPQALIAFGAEPPEIDTGTQTFYVRDNGAGFDPTAATRLFTPFGRLHPAHDFPGHGVGLATCQRIIHRHGGQIWADAKPGEGAVFSFSLPIAGQAAP